MHNIALYTTTNNLKNKIFSRECRDNVSEKWILLREELLKLGINFNTFDTYDDLDCISASVYLNVNNEYLSNDSSRLKILIIGEPPIVHKPNGDYGLRKHFDYVFSWEYSSQSGKNYPLGYGCSAKLNYDINIIKDFTNRELLTTIVSNKKVSHLGELYSERLRAIEFFTNSDIPFDFYGLGWEKRSFAGIKRVFNKIPPLRTFNYSPPPSYKGTVSNKSDTLSGYRFSICYENMLSEQLYITEKIFDSMFSGCIPIYLGSSLISNIVPQKCFIDARPLLEYSKLKSFLVNYDFNSYLKTLKAIATYYPVYTNSTYSAAGWSTYLADHFHKIISLSHNQI